MSLFLGSIYASMELDTSKLGSQVSEAKRTITGLGNSVGDMSQRGERSFGDLVKASALGNIAAVGFSKGIGLLENSFGTATKRVDTLNNSTRSFLNMGFDQQTISSTMDKINKSILGLPTSLDSAVRMVTLFAAATGDLPKSQRLFAALNNGILGFGGTADQVNTAVIQLSQSFAGGRVYAQDWYSMLNAGLGPALNAIAKQMGITTNELKEGLGDGSIAVSDFQDQLIKLNEQGGGGLASLEKIAQDSTKGINTGIANAQTAIARGMASILGAIGTERISGAIAGFGSSFENGLKSFSGIVERSMPTIIGILEGVGKAFKFIADNKDIFLPMAAAIGTAVVAFKVYNTVVAISTAATAAYTAVSTYFTLVASLQAQGLGLLRAAWMGLNIVMAANPIGLVIAAIAAIVVGLALFFTKTETGKKIMAAFGDFLVGLWEGIKVGFNAVVTFFQNAWNTIAGFFQKYGVVILAFVAPFIGIPLLIYQHWGQITAFFSNLWTTVTTVFTNAVNGVIDFFAQLPYRIGFILGATARFFIDFYTVTIPNFVMGVIQWISTLPGTIAGFFTQMWQSAVALITSLVNDVTSWVSQLPGRIATWFSATKTQAVNYTSSLISDVINFFAGLPGRAASAISGLASSIAGKFNEMWSSSMNALKNFGSEVVGFMKDLPGKMLSAVGNIAGAAYNKFKDIAGSMWNGFKDGLGIHSPSYIEHALFAIDDQGAATVKNMNSQMRDLNALAASAQRVDFPTGTTGGSDFGSGPGYGSGDTYQIDQIILPNVQNPGDFAREFKLATAGR